MTADQPPSHKILHSCNIHALKNHQALVAMYNQKFKYFKVIIESIGGEVVLTVLLLSGRDLVGEFGTYLAHLILFTKINQMIQIRSLKNPN